MSSSSSLQIFILPHCDKTERRKKKHLLLFTYLFTGTSSVVTSLEKKTPDRIAIPFMKLNCCAPFTSME